MRLADLAGRRVAVWGTGREGIAAVRAIAAVRPAALHAVLDREPGPDAESWPADLAALAPLVAGPPALALMSTVDVVVRSPGVAQTHPWVVELRAGGVPVTGGTALWLAEHAGATIGITGSKGKSTTTSLVSHLLAALGRPNVIGGNIGTAVLSLPPAACYVLELSMYQCADLTDSPDIAVVTSLYPEHLDWSGGQDAYYRDKLNLLGHGPRVAVLNGADAVLRAQVAARYPDLAVRLAGGTGGFHVGTGPDGTPWLWYATQPLFPRARLRLVGRHNEANLCVALEVLAAAGVDPVGQRTELAAALDSFAPLEHRLTPIEDPSGVLFVDDSISTIPQSAIHAIEAYAGRPLTVLLGGTDRGVDYAPLRDFLRERAVTATVIGMPDSGPRILAELAGLPELTLLTSDSLAHAVALARARTPAGGVVLLSPAAPSYGHFDNFEHRSQVFRQLIRDTAPGD